MSKSLINVRTSDGTFSSLPSFKGADGKSATVTIGSVTTGDEVRVTNSGDENDAVLDFVLPSTVKTPFDVIGDGSTKEFTFTHNRNTLDITVTIYDKSDNEDVICSIKRIDTNNVRIGFENPPAVGTNYRVLIS